MEHLATPVLSEAKPKTGDKKDLATRVAVSFIYELWKIEINLKPSEA